MSETPKETHALWTNLFNVIEPVKPYFLGALSGIGATCIIQPLDIIKTRIMICAKQKAAGNTKVTTNPFTLMK